MRKIYKITALILICLLSSSGCLVYNLAKGTRPDLSSVEVGATREDVEDVLGSPDKECPARNSNYRMLYFFNYGYKPRPMEIPDAIILDVITLGISEVIAFPIYMFGGETHVMKVVYDKNDVVLSYWHHALPVLIACESFENPEALD